LDIDHEWVSLDCRVDREGFRGTGSHREIRRQQHHAGTGRSIVVAPAKSRLEAKEIRMNGRTKSLLGLLALSLVGFAVLSAQTAITTDGLVESTSGGFKFPDGSIQTTAVVPGVAPVADTGQQSCSDVDGVSIACGGTGQDGEYQAGVAWPSPRLVDNADGTITDLMTGLMWLQEADCLSFANWEDALAKIDEFNTTSIACMN